MDYAGEANGDVAPLELVDAAGTVIPALVIISWEEGRYGVPIQWAGREVSAGARMIIDMTRPEAA